MILHVCPECASAKVELGDLVGDEMTATCSNCGWTGKHKDLIGAGAKANDIVQGSLSIDDPSLALSIAREVSVMYMRMLAKHAGQPIGLAMVESGLVGRQDSSNLARLIKAACQGAHTATLNEVEKIQKELQDERRSTAS